MSVRIITDKDSGDQVLYCSTTDFAFGPIIDSEYDAEYFLEWLSVDARKYTDDELSDQLSIWKENCELLSECCAEPPSGEVIDGLGICSHCKEHAGF